MTEKGDTPPLPLTGRGIVVTRPIIQAKRFANLIEAGGGRPILFPAIEIHDTESPAVLASALQNLNKFGIAVFVSANAVKAVASRLDLPLPENLCVAAIGLGTKRELVQLGIIGIVVPESGFDSESLLGLPEMQDVSGKRVVIFRGNGGRNVLGDSLLARGAQVEYVECYRRAKPDVDVNILFSEWQRGTLDAISVTSVEGLRNLADMLGERGKPNLSVTPLFVPHQRIAHEANALGITQVIVTGTGDEAMLAAMAKLFGGNCDAE